MGVNHQGHEEHKAALGLFRQFRIPAGRADRPPGREEGALGLFRQFRIAVALGSEDPRHLVLPGNGFVFAAHISENRIQDYMGQLLTATENWLRLATFSLLRHGLQRPSSPEARSALPISHGDGPIKQPN